LIPAGVILTVARNGKSQTKMDLWALGVIDGESMETKGHTYCGNFWKIDLLPDLCGILGDYC
jgi:hypothetical protein